MPKMRYCSHIQAKAAQSSFSKVERVQSCFRGLTVPFPDRSCSIAALQSHSRPKLPNPYFSKLREFKAVFAALQSLSHKRCTGILSPYNRNFHRKYLDKRHSLVPSVQAFAAKTRLVITKGKHHTPSFRILLVRKEFYFHTRRKSYFL